MNTEWYYTTDRKTKIGPVTLEELLQLATTGTLLRSHLVLKAGDQKWVAAESLPGLFPPQAVPSPRPVAIPVSTSQRPCAIPVTVPQQGDKKRLPWGLILVPCMVLVAVVAIGMYLLLRDHSSGSPASGPALAENRSDSGKEPNASDRVPIGSSFDTFKSPSESENPPALKPRKDERDRLQGVWIAEQIVVNGKTLPEPYPSTIALVFRANTVEWIDSTGDERAINRFNTDANVDPKTIDLEILTGDNKGKTKHGIYHETDGKLKLCFRPTSFGVGDRPKEFKSATGAEQQLLVLTRLTQEVPPAVEKGDEKKREVLLASQIHKRLVTDPAATIYKYQGKQVTVKGEVTTVEATKLGFTEAKAMLFLVASPDFTHGNDTIPVVFTATKDKPFSFRFLQYLNGLEDGTTVTATGRCEIRRKDGKFELFIQDASVTP
jgi:uncharacterized protein (TIGR03067 family)